MNDIIADLNLLTTMAKQNDKCLECGADLNPDRMYFRMDQKAKPEVYEVYCEVCGIDKEKEDREQGKVISDERN